MSRQLQCPKCSEVLAADAFERHLRLELRYYPWKCGLCLINFLSAQEARKHFGRRFGPHSGEAEVIVETISDEKEEELATLFDAATEPWLKEEATDQSQPFPAHMNPPLVGELSIPVVPMEPPPFPMPPLPLKRPRWADDRAEEPKTRPQDDDEEEPEFPPEEPPPEMELQLNEKTRDDASESQDSPWSDGSVACVLCGSRQKPSTFRRHASRQHMDMPFLQCSRCDVKCHNHPEMRVHQKKVHVMEMTSNTYTNNLRHMSKALNETIERCFGSVRVAGMRYFCQPCKQSLSVNFLRGHITSRHIKQATYTCNLCDFSTTNWIPCDVKTHMSRQHAGDRKNFTSHRARLTPTIKLLATQLFGPNAPV